MVHRRPRALAILVVAALPMLPSLAAAQTLPAPTVPSLAGPPPTVPPAPPSPPLVRLYGFVRAEVATANSGVESYGRPNHSAPTSAANPVTTIDDSAPSMSFQVAQSRFGLSIGEATPVRAKIEMDFIDFSRASPTVAALPRLRIASIEWVASPSTSVFAGQMWDLVAPLMPHHYNFVGANFQAGNLGFMRHQLGVRHALGDVELKAALGLAGNNNNTALTDLEFEGLPTFAASATWRPATGVMVSLSGLGTQLRFGPGHEQAAGVGAVDFEYARGPVSVRVEGYIGQNTANLGMLTLGYGRADHNVADAGGWLSARVAFAEHHAVYLTAGAASVLQPSELTPGYTRATATGGNSAAARNFAVPGIEWNAAARVGYSISPVTGLTFALEPYLFATRHHLDAADAAVDPTRLAYGAEFNTVYAF